MSTPETPPTGTVTFLFTDIEGSTRLAQDHPASMPALLERHHAILRGAIEAHGGYVFQITGDSFSAAFHTATAALSAALAAQLRLAAETWSPAPVSVRMGIHTGETAWQGSGQQEQYDNYATLAMAARVMSAGHGGQILLSTHAHDLAAEHPPSGAAFKALGEYHLKDFTQPQTIYQLVHPGLPADFPPLKTLKSVRNNLPPALTSFIGRERELAEAQSKLAAARLLTLTGPGGTGKTRLSQQIALEQIGHFTDGAWLVELAPLSDPAFIPSALAAVFGLREMQGVPLLDIAVNYLRAKELLLLLDNCEHLVEESARIAQLLLEACPYLKIVASSREALGVPGETVYRVPSLAESEAARLFVERAARTEPRFQLTNENTPFIAQICARLDGIPLAIELAAARIRVFTPREIAERLDDRFRLLSGGSRTALPRQQTLRALVDWSYQTLTETEQLALRGLSVFSGGWTYEAAEAVAGPAETLDGLPGLVNKSLVNVDERDGASRYDFLETIRQFALDRLLDAGEAASARTRHLEFFLGLAESVAQLFAEDRDRHAASTFELEHDNVRSALRWALEHDPLKALRMATVLSDLWLERGYLTEGGTWIRAALEAVENAPGSDEAADPLRARGYIVSAHLANNQGEHDRARSAAETAIALYGKVGDAVRLPRALIVHATAAFFGGDPETGMASLREAIRLSRLSDDKRNLTWALATLAYLTFETKGVAAREEIDAYIEESVRTGREIDSPWMEATVKDYQARAAYLRGDVDEARVHAEEVMRHHREMGNTFALNNYRSTMAHALRQSGHYDEAVAIYRETISAYQEMGHRGAVAHQLECLAYIAAARKEYARAVVLLAAAEALRETAAARRTPQEQAEYETHLAALQVALGDGAFEAAWEEGRGMKMERAVEVAITDPKGLGNPSDPRDL